MKKLWVAVALVGIAPAGLGFGPPALLASDNSRAPLFAQQVPIVQAFQPPAISAASALVAEGRSDFTFFARGKDDRRAMASVTKIMTALLAVERGGLDEEVTVDVDASQMPDSSVMGLRPGEALTLEDLLYGLLLPSGNDAALAIAKAIGGSEAGFVALMNQRAAQLGLLDTRFANPHGLDDPRHYSTAADLLALSRAAMANPEFAKIVATKEREVVGKRFVYRLRNTNQLLGQYLGVEGVKTGETDAAGQCLVTAQRRGELLIFSVVLGSSARFEDTKALLDYSSSRFDCQSPTPPTSGFDRLPGGAPNEATPGEGRSEQPELRVAAVAGGLPDCRPLWQARWRWADVRWAGELAGTVSYFVGDEAVGSQEVVLR